MAGKIIFISGPSGAGKGTIIDALRERHESWIFPPSCTTRDPRPGEVEGETYYYISKEEFQRRIDAGLFLEHAEVHGGNFYGTLKAPLIEGVEAGNIVIREFDVQGYEAARDILPREYFASIFIDPPSEEVLIQRIKNRAPISEEDLTHRIESMRKELAKRDLYDHHISSAEGDIEGMIQEAEDIIAEETSL